MTVVDVLLLIVLWGFSFIIARVALVDRNAASGMAMALIMVVYAFVGYAVFALVRWAPHPWLESHRIIASRLWLLVWLLGSPFWIRMIIEQLIVTAALMGHIHGETQEKRQERRE